MKYRMRNMTGNSEWKMPIEITDERSKMTTKAMATSSGQRM